MIDFIGIGAQRTGTSWVYACLYEHSEICAPIKEIHFFSRARYEKGLTWYEDHFKKCNSKKKGEFSTSYLYSSESAKRIHDAYPNTRIIAILRNPIDRAVSQYGNARKGGEIPESMTFEEYAKSDKSVLAQGLYAKQLKRYLELFSHEQIHVMIYEDAKKDPKKYIQGLYSFLEVNDSYEPSMLSRTVNNTRLPRFIILERWMHYIAEFLRKHGLDGFVHWVRKTGVTDAVRSVNTKENKEDAISFDHEVLTAFFREDTRELGRLIGRDVAREWNIT